MKHRLFATLTVVASLGLATTAMAEQGQGGIAEMELPAPEGCAPMQWNLANVDGRLHGIVWYTDGQGFGSAISNADPKTGAFSITITPVFGSMAPQGEITGRVENGDIHLHFHGGKCADMKAVVKQGTHKAIPE